MNRPAAAPPGCAVELAVRESRPPTSARTEPSLASTTVAASDTLYPLAIIGEGEIQAILRRLSDIAVKLVRTISVALVEPVCNLFHLVEGPVQEIVGAFILGAIWTTLAGWRRATAT